MNGRDEPVRLARAFALFETETAWAALGPGSEDEVPAGESARILLTSGHLLGLGDRFGGVSLQVRAGRRSVPFPMRVPLARPDTLVRQSPPRRLRLLRSTWPRSLLFSAAITAVAAYFLGRVATVGTVSQGRGGRGCRPCSSATSGRGRRASPRRSSHVGRAGERDLRVRRGAIVACYRYPTRSPREPKAAAGIAVGVQCDGRRWRIGGWLPG